MTQRCEHFYVTSTRFTSQLCTKIPSSGFRFWPSSSFPVILRLRFGLRSNSNPLVFKSFTNSYFAPTMESPGSDLVVEEQLVRKNSNRGASSSAETPRPRQAYEPNVETHIRPPSVSVDGPGGNRSRLIIMRPMIIKTDIPSVFKQSDMSYLKERFDMPSQVKLSACDLRKSLLPRVDLHTTPSR
ncbi:hypothetical protein FNV43_RR11137 [Rhamnella rubrinervis]|uniref:Uncharacterized protein n=1 Tax=Rhamnella rubrinervis TaxID=2594499 RepID=A0A8K0H595_9ROSA|nr:hypothetical protein FNV43_RR11137 [Rhamnella rubrinervis]